EDRLQPRRRRTHADHRAGPVVADRATARPGRCLGYVRGTDDIDARNQVVPGEVAVTLSGVRVVDRDVGRVVDDVPEQTGLCGALVPNDRELEVRAAAGVEVSQPLLGIAGLAKRRLRDDAAVLKQVHRQVVLWPGAAAGTGDRLVPLHFQIDRQTLRDRQALQIVAAAEIVGLHLPESGQRRLNGGEGRLVVGVAVVAGRREIIAARTQEGLDSVIDRAADLEVRLVGRVNVVDDDIHAGVLQSGDRVAEAGVGGAGGGEIELRPRSRLVDEFGHRAAFVFAVES